MNDNIELIKSEIYETKSNLQKFNKLLQTSPENEAYSLYVTALTNRLNILNQIKAELEAWEVIKNLCSINYFSHNIDLPMEYRGKIAKALEVSNND